MQQQVGLRVTLGEFLVALPHNVGQVTVQGNLIRHTDFDEGAHEHDLARRRRQQVLPPQHVGDLHEGVIHRVDQRVKRIPVGADNDVVRHRPGLERHFAADQVVERDVLIRHAHADHGFTTLGVECCLLFVGEVAVEPVVSQLRVTPGSPVPLLHLVGGGEGFVGIPALEQLRRHLLVKVHALRLAVGAVGAADANALVPIQAQPAH